MATEEIEISELELAEELAPDNLIPIESLTDTKATTLQKIKEWLGSFFVDKTSDEEIGGEKVFNGKLKFRTDASYVIEEIINSYTRGSIPSSQIITGIELSDKNEEKTGRFYQAFGTDGDMSSRMICFNSDGSKNAWLGVGFKGNGSMYSYAPECALQNSIVTTTAISKSGNGYVKLGNGIIIQWGNSSTPNTVTFPTAFTSTPQVVISTSHSEKKDDARVSSTYNVTKTSFKSHRYGSEVFPFRWIAIGY